MAVANVDAHVSAPAGSVTEPGTLVAIMGTSICHIVLSETAPAVPGMCGFVRDGVVPGLYGFEAGQASVGDLFGWFVDNGVPPLLPRRTTAPRVTVHDLRRRRPPSFSRADRGCWRSTGGTATGPSSSMPICPACSSA